MEEGEDFGTADLASSIIGDAVTLVLLAITGDVTDASPVVEDVAHVDSDQDNG
ncbi:hypothetical protein PVK06_026560 [Gossypium arboreum]|uniref:Uncharacterized protein n=1 Tax=Gossypium arboreum TaxID=29729 RepID=A0ABR0NY00_GOSAR|nr:hypothetical protein PVK06_026560 [Gossypium arboreum]